MSQFLPSATPAPDDLPPEEEQQHQQPDPFGDPADEEGEPQHEGAPDESHKSDPRAE
jgi:hypothetical protein